MARGRSRRRGPYVHNENWRFSSPHIDRFGRPKKRYRNQTEAQQAAAATFAINRVDLDSYQCSECHGWHNGNRHNPGAF